MINIAICDDNPLDLTQLEGSILNLSKALNLPVCLTTYPDGKALLAHLDHTDFTAIFLDIFMADLNGIDVAQAIAKRSDAFIIFTTTSSEFALEAIDLGAVHYLIKPITEEALREVYRRCAARSTKRRDPFGNHSGSEKTNPLSIGYPIHCRQQQNLDYLYLDGLLPHLRGDPPPRQSSRHRTFHRPPTQLYC